MIPGEIRVRLAPEVWQGLTVEEVLPVLRHPEDRNQAVLERTLR